MKAIAMQSAPMARTQAHWLWLAPLVLLIALLAGTAIGETAIPVDTILKVLANHLLGANYAVDRIDAGIIWNYRLSRALVAACCGSALALAGVVLQALLRNPLADPYLMGISAGASTGAVAVTVAGLGAGALTLSAGHLPVLASRLVWWYCLPMQPVAVPAAGVALRRPGPLFWPVLQALSCLTHSPPSSLPSRPVPSKPAASCFGFWATFLGCAGTMWQSPFLPPWAAC